MIIYIRLRIFSHCYRMKVEILIILKNLHSVEGNKKLSLPQTPSDLLKVAFCRRHLDGIGRRTTQPVGDGVAS